MRLISVDLIEGIAGQDTIDLNLLEDGDKDNLLGADTLYTIRSTFCVMIT